MNKSFDDQHISLIGAGKMADTIVSGMLMKHPQMKNRICMSDHAENRLKEMQDKHGVKTCRDNSSAVKDADIVIVCVKPQNTADVFDEIGGLLNENQILVSIMAGVKINTMETRIPKPVPVIRAMPNTPAQVFEGMTALAAGSHATSADMEITARLFQVVGRTVMLDEQYFDAVTGLSASGPAFIYIIIEALADGGVKCGLSREVAFQLAAQMTLGASKMVVETAHHPAVLKDHVTTPAGCTIDGILKLEEGGVRIALIKAVTEAVKRAGELG